MLFHFRSNAVGASLLAVALTLVSATSVTAANAVGFLKGALTQDGQPVPNDQVTASGNNRTLSVTSDAGGNFTFPPLSVGTYLLSAKNGDHTVTQSVDLGTSGATVSLQLQEPSEIGHIVVTTQQVPQAVIHGSGSDVVLNSTQITQMPYNNSFAQMEIQQPGAVRGANGVVHLNGDHGVINYLIDGVALPQELNRDIGTEINLNDLSFIDLIEGAYPAQYGLKFGSVFNMATRAGTGPPGFYGSFSYGSYTTGNGLIGFHAPITGGGGYDIAISGFQTTRGLDPPNFGSPHNDASALSEFARFTLPASNNDFTNITFINGRSNYQIPNDVDNGEPADTNDNETQADTFLSSQFHHILGQTGSLTFGATYKASQIQDFGDPQNDWIYGENLNVEAPPYGNGGSSTDCANALTPGATYLPTTCAVSLDDTRTAIDLIFQVDYNQSFGKHQVAAGVAYDNTRVLKYYAITLQPGNYLAPIATPSTPGAPTTVIDNSPNTANTYSAYVQDSWRMSNLWEVDYGIRDDYFNIMSTGFNQGFGAVSPRLKITRYWGDRASLYGYIGRFFEPFSFENVSPSAAYLLNLPLQPTEAQFDLLPERDTDLEFGGHVPLGAGDLGFRVWQKNANDLIDDTQVGVTLLHQDINYALGRLSQEAINYVQPLVRNGRFYFSVAHVMSLNSGCETQLLAPCFGAPTGYTPADHEQNWTVNGGILLNNRRGGWFAADGEYGSGLSSSQNPTGGITCAGVDLAQPLGGPCKRTPHTVFDVEDGIALSPSTDLTLSIQNILNDRYFVTYLNAQGNHYAPPRVFEIGLRFR